jgi:RHS repeat-associated protein
MNRLRLFAAFLLLAVAAVAQDDVRTGNSTNVGLPDNGLFSGSNIDNVQVNNGNLHIQIPVVTVPGRGMSNSKQFVYDSRGYYAAEVLGPEPQFIYQVKWENGNTTKLSLTTDWGYHATKTPHVENCPDGRHTVYTNFTIREPNGTKHHFEPDEEGSAGCNITYPKYADDGSGWKLDGNGTVSKSGVQIGVSYSASNWNSAFGTGPFSTTASITDTNGNKITTTADTLGRAHPSDYQYYDSDGTLQTITVNTTTMTFDSQNLCGNLTPTSYPTSCVGFDHEITVPTSLVLPDGRSYSFTYASSGMREISSITLPDGAVISYTYGYFTNYAGVADMGGRRVTSRTVTVNGVSSTWAYDYYSSQDLPIDHVKVTAPDNSYTITYFALPTQAPASLNHVWKVESFSAAGQLLKREETEYHLGVAQTLPKAVTTTVFSTVAGDSTVTKRRTETDYDSYTGVYSQLNSYGNPVETREFVYDSAGSNPQLIRRTHTSYLHQSNSTYQSANILDRVVDQTTYDGGTAGAAVPYGTTYSGGNKIAQTTTTYDEYPTYMTSAKGAGIPGHDDAYNSAYALRGNPTTTTRWRNTDNQYLASHNYYDDLGHLVKSTDPLGHSTDFDYSDAGNLVNLNAVPGCNPPSNSYAFLTQTTDALGHRNSTKYYACSGLPYSKRDENDIAAAREGTKFEYDILNRPYDVRINGDLAWSYRYPSATSITSSQTIDKDANLKVERIFTLDSLGRVIQSMITSAGSCNAKVDTTYDFAGRVKTVSNPYCSTSDSTYGITTNEYDGVGRLTKTIPPDGTTYVNNVRTEFGGNFTISTDQAGRKRKTYNDPLGRLIRVDEPGPLTAAQSQSTGSFTISGSEQNHNDPGANATGTITLSGTCTGATRQKKIFDGPSWYWLVDSGGVSVTINGFTANSSYQSATALATQLTNALNGASSPVTASLSGSVITVTAKTKGPNYAMSVTNSWNTDGWTTALCAGSLSGSAMTGGVYPVTNAYDTGNVNLTVSGFTATTTYGASSTSSTLATALANVFNNDAQSPVTAVASGSGISLTSKAFGAVANYGLSATSSSTQGSFSSPSFSASPSGSAMTGGSDGTGGLAAPYTTLYTYDNLDRLTCVEQHGDVGSSTGCSSPESSDATSSWRVRRFTYDSLGELLTAKNPESGLLTYAYNNDGTLISKTSPSPNQTGTATLTITYSNDQLHRLTGKTYSNSEPSVTYSYDQTSYNGLTITNGKGRRTGMSDASGTTAWSYDEIGRAKAEQRTIAGITKTMSHTYNLDSSLKSLTYPSNAVVNFTYDGAARPLTAVDTGNTINYATDALYTAFNAPTMIKFGVVSGGFAGYQLNTPVTTNPSTNSYNKRLQPLRLVYEIPGTGTIMSRAYSYGPALQNNGNISAITNGVDSDRSVTYTYDQLNRIASAQSANTDCSTVSGTSLTKNWGNTYTIDAWGNLTAKPVTKCSSETLSTTVNLKNQLGVGTHDAAGNLMNNGAATYTYDAENRISSTAGVTYTYDGDGVRVKKSTGTLYFGESFTDGPITETDLSGTIKAEYVYFGGKRIARRDFPGGSVHYYFSDHLKSVNLVYNATGTLEEDSDFYPYGGERAYVTGTGNHFKFTGKERDTESGLDYFGARYYGNSLGRFLTPDWADKATAVPYAEFTDPQSLNLYGYVGNRPIAKLDVDGHCPWCVGALVGAVAGAGMEIYKQHKEGNGFNVAKIGGKALQGGVVGAVAVATGGASLLAQAGAAAGANAAMGVVARGTDNDNQTKAIDKDEIATDVVAGTIGGAAGKVAGDVVADVVRASPLIQNIGAKAADNVAKSITPGAKGANQLLFNATMKVAELPGKGVSSAIKATVNRVTTDLVKGAAPTPSKASTAANDQPPK